MLVHFRDKKWSSAQENRFRKLKADVIYVGAASYQRDNNTFKCKLFHAMMLELRLYSNTIFLLYICHITSPLTILWLSSKVRDIVMHYIWCQASTRFGWVKVSTVHIELKSLTADRNGWIIIGIHIKQHNANEPILQSSILNEGLSNLL